MLDLEVVPGHSLRHKAWEFILGMPLQQSIEILRKNDHTIRAVEFWYSTKVPFQMDLVLYLPNDGIKLHFDPVEQRLKMIDVHDMSKVILRYYSSYFNSPTILPTLGVIDQSFGATTPPKRDSRSHDWHLTFRGVSFVLCQQTCQSPSAPQLSFLGDSGSASGNALYGTAAPNEAESCMVARKMTIFSGLNPQEAKVPPPLPSDCYHGNAFLKKLEVVHEGTTLTKLVFHLFAQTFRSGHRGQGDVIHFTREVRFGDRAQDVLSALGSSSRVFYKAEDKMKIHCPQAHRLIQSQKADYFYNYFTLGVDLLMDARSHRVKKCVLHTNFPGHYNFNTYQRCRFEITLPRYSPSIEESPEVETSPQMFTIDPLTKWSTIQKALGKSHNEEPVVLKRSGNGNTVNPFGDTHCFGVRDMIFEIIPANEHIASVTLYQPNPLTQANVQ